MEPFKAAAARFWVFVEFVPLFFIWFVAIPYLFILLYSVLEMQSAAKAATGTNSKLATYLVMTRATQITQVHDRLDKLATQFQQAQDNYNLQSAAYTVLHDKFLDDVTFLAASVQDPNFNSQACAGAGVVDRESILSCARTVIQYATGRQAVLAGAPATNANVASATVSDTLLGTVMGDLPNFEQQYSKLSVSYSALSYLKQQSSTAMDAYKSLVGVTGSTIGDPDMLDNEADDAFNESNRRLARAQSAPAAGGQANGAATPAANGAPQAAPDSSDSASAPATDNIGSVATSYNNMTGVWFFMRLFRMPPGAVVALFTALMGAIGSAVYSLLQSVVRGRHAITAMDGWIFYGGRPVLGAMAGFMVFFVVSAGTAFLIQPGAASATDAVNSLSPPALASLGVFAGIAAESALKWLNVKATSFFETNDKEHEPAQIAAE